VKPGQPAEIATRFRARARWHSCGRATRRVRRQSRSVTIDLTGYSFRCRTLTPASTRLFPSLAPLLAWFFNFEPVHLQPFDRYFFFEIGFQQTDPVNQALNKGSSDYDVRHHFQLSGYWELPWLRRARLRRDDAWWLDTGGVFDKHTGFPFSGAYRQL